MLMNILNGKNLTEETCLLPTENYNLIICNQITLHAFYLTMRELSATVCRRNITISNIYNSAEIGFTHPTVKVNGNTYLQSQKTIFILFREDGSFNVDKSVQSLEDQLQSILEIRKKLELELTKVIEFEEKLAQILPQQSEALRPDMLTPYSITNLSQEFPFLDWTDFFNSALQTTASQGK